MNLKLFFDASDPFSLEVTHLLTYEYVSLYFLDIFMKHGFDKQEKIRKQFAN
jgi:hypothetical protein